MKECSNGIFALRIFILIKWLIFSVWLRFGETRDSYELFKSAEANFIIIKNDFLTTLIMKGFYLLILPETFYEFIFKI